MGDRCYIEIVIPSEQLDEFVKLENGFGTPSSVSQEEPLSQSKRCLLTYDEVNYGGVDQVQAAVAAGIKMYVRQGPGSDYGAYVGISNGDGNYVELPSVNGKLYLHVKVADGKYEIDFEALIDLQRFAVELKKAEDTWLN